ncbi:hypothetical protein QAD02_013292 [Eretmocerus hayati]|uniref:Uncharacterized protein n=1 Tax=Eretmocerus hayati TaxID=131215 RepID=A0ACC2P6T3_9HYME|nr:hypothetical protein QAD02_013292 [Eretmocerus hayati]
MESRSNNVEANISHVQSKVESIAHHSILVVPAEMIFKDIPKEMSLDQNTVVTKLLEALDHPELIGFVLEVREWKGPSLGNPNVQLDNHTVASTNSQPPPHTALNSDPTFDNTPEFIIAELSHGSNKISFAVVYRRPKGAYPIYFFETLSNLSPLYNDMIITGDFNADLASEKPEAIHLRSLLAKYSLYCVPSEPTHHELSHDPPSHTWLDLFIVNDIGSVTYYDESKSPFITGHDLIELQFKFHKPPKMKKNYYV